jgi:hypothetical protein
MRECCDLFVAQTEDRSRHSGIGAAAAVGEVLFHRMDHVVDASFREPRHLLLAHERRHRLDPTSSRIRMSAFRVKEAGWQ